uniref:Omega-hydroxypalmitate O-feruloyl transferase n=1 Tax=Picea sitchensis TaxID=3332 RepID=A9NTA5_PICSI|nr:unknown [Picea sitchensis]
MENPHIYCSQVQLPVTVIESVMVPPSRPSPKTSLYLSNLDDHLIVRCRFDTLLVYTNDSHNIYGTTNPVKVIRNALSLVLSHYYPLAGRIRRTQDGRKLQVDCTGEGALFVEAVTNNNLSLLGGFEELKDQLLFQFPLTAEVEEVPPLIFQVTRFGCGGFVVGVSFNHCLCDGRGAAQFLKGVAEIARGETKLSVEPVWQREFLKPQQQPHLVRFQHGELLESGFIVNPNCSMQKQLPAEKAEDLALTSFFLSSDALQRIKQPIVEDLKENCTTFEVLAALAWRARIMALGIPLNNTVRLLFGVDMRRAFDPPLPEGYYGNGSYLASEHSTTAEEVVNGSLSHAVKMIKKAKLSLNEEYVRSSIAFLETNRSCQDVRVCVEDTYLSDWRWLGFNEVDFGWGEPVIACPGNWLKMLLCPILFLLPPKGKGGVMMVFCVPRTALKALQTQLDCLM